MTDLKCRVCGHQESWKAIKESDTPGEHDDHKERAEKGEAHTAKIVCPECGNDSFDRVEDDGQDGGGGESSSTDMEPGQLGNESLGRTPTSGGEPPISPDAWRVNFNAEKYDEWKLLSPISFQGTTLIEESKAEPLFSAATIQDTLVGLFEREMEDVSLEFRMGYESALTRVATRLGLVENHEEIEELFPER